jgi:hypothetical protein
MEGAPWQSPYSHLLRCLQVGGVGDSGGSKDLQSDPRWVKVQWERLGFLQKFKPWSTVMLKEDKRSLGWVLHGEKHHSAILHLSKQEDQKEHYRKPYWWAYIYPPCKAIFITLFSASDKI